MKTLVLGMGNPILSDDGVGLQVVAELKTMLCRPDVDLMQTELGGINLLELLVGYDRAIIVDAIQTQNSIPGKIHVLNPESLWRSRHVDSTHNFDFPRALELGKKLGMALPTQITIFAIEAGDVETFGDACTPAVQKSISSCVEKICQVI